MRRSRVTLKDVADRVGLSVNTVSRALTGKDQVSEETRRTIELEALRLGYRPNQQARSLVLGKTMVIGLVITNVSNPFYADLISVVERECRAVGYSVLLLVTDESYENERDAVRQLLRYDVDGVLGVPVQGGDHAWDQLRQAGLPAVLVSRDLPELEFDYVGTDVQRGLADAVARIAATEVRTAWLLEEDLDISTTAARTEGFRTGLHQVGVAGSATEVMRVPTHRDQGGVSLPWRIDEAYQLAGQLLSERRHPDLIVTGSDHVALGVQRAAHERGLDIPRDLQILGYGDHPFAAYVEPGLSTLRLPSADIATLAVRRLLDLVAGADDGRQVTLLPPVLVRRGSTRPPTPDRQVPRPPTRTSSRRRR